MATETQDTDSSGPISTQPIINDMLAAVIEREREREIITRRYGLFDRRETLEQIGELLGITRERVRQLEKAVMAKLRTNAEQGGIPHLSEVGARFVSELTIASGAARVSELAGRMVAQPSRDEQSRLIFLAYLCPQVVVIDDDNDFYPSLALASLYTAKSTKEAVTRLINAIKEAGQPTAIEALATAAHIDDPNQARALATLSKKLATLHGTWGLVKWPTVNPKNIRDKIYVILQQRGTHMHFNEIADAIKGSTFKRKDVTTQAIHNELIKDSRFVLIGRGLYALQEWGYERGTVADIIAQVLRDAQQPLHRDDIVKRVLETRHVKETTVLLNLQGKPQFKRVAKATYALADAA